MCCDYTDYAEEMRKLKLEVLAEVVPSIRGLATFDEWTYFRAMLQMYSALKAGSFNQYRARDAELWEVIAQSIRIRVDSDYERTYMLAALFSHFLPAIGAKFEERYCERMLSRKLPIAV